MSPVEAPLNNVKMPSTDITELRSKSACTTQQDDCKRKDSKSRDLIYSNFQKRDKLGLLSMIERSSEKFNVRILQELLKAPN